MVWFVYGMIVGAGGMKLFDWMRDSPRSIAWYSWVCGLCALLFVTLAVQHFFASYRELEHRAAWVGLFSLGIPGIILAGITGWLIVIG